MMLISPFCCLAAISIVDTSQIIMYTCSISDKLNNDTTGVYTGYMLPSSSMSAIEVIGDFQLSIRQLWCDRVYDSSMRSIY